ncbi:MAG: VanZ family protein [Vicinamibacterales bacterium]
MSQPLRHPPLSNTRTLLRCLLPLAIILVVTTWPWRFQDHSHWASVEWLPFTKYRRPGDWIANIGLFIPLGVAYAWGGTARRRVREAVLLGLGVSLAVELAQVFTHGRAPTVADVIANGLGTWAGARWAIAPRRRRAPAATTSPT